MYIQIKQSNFKTASFYFFCLKTQRTKKRKYINKIIFKLILRSKRKKERKKISLNYTFKIKILFRVKIFIAIAHFDLLK